MKRIIVVLDGLCLERKTMDIAIKLALAEKSVLVGLFPESFLYHQYELTQMMGKNGISQVKIKHAFSREEEKRKRSKAAFSRACEKAGIIFNIKITQGITIDEVLHESAFSDMIIVSKNERFFIWEKRVPSNFISQLLASSSCPVFLVDDKNLNIERIVLLYDGKASSVYAFRFFFLLLSSMRGIPCEVLHTTEGNMLQEMPDLDKLRELLDCHRPETVFTLLSGPEKHTITGYIKKLGNGTLAVTGAYGRGNTSRWLMPSIADSLLLKSDCALFVAHNL